MDSLGGFLLICTVECLQDRADALFESLYLLGWAFLESCLSGAGCLALKL